MKRSNFKNYDPDLNERAGLISKTAIREWCYRTGFSYQPIDEGAFGFDAVVADVPFELETRYNWKEGNRPFYSIINIPLRRARHLQHNSRWMYAQVSGDGKAFLVLPNPQTVFPQSPQQYSKNKDDDGYPEAFYKIPREQFKWLFVDHTCQDEQDFIEILCGS